MASKHTEKYLLNQWEGSDQVLRTDFNEDNLKIETALAGLESGKAGQGELEALGRRMEALEGLPQIVTGTYTGDGAASRMISLGFTPRALLVLTESGCFSRACVDYFYGGLAFPDNPVCLRDNYGTDIILQIVENGFQVYYDYDEGIYSNQKSTNFHYLALK